MRVDVLHPKPGIDENTLAATTSLKQDKHWSSNSSHCHLELLESTIPNVVCCIMTCQCLGLFLFFVKMKLVCGLTRFVMV